jgi:ATP-dependent RNA helicase DHX57
MRIRQEKSPSAMRAFCSEVRPQVPLPLFPAFLVSLLTPSPRHKQPPQTQNYISATTIRDVSVLRNDLLSALASAGLVQAGQPASAPELNAHAREPALLKALLLAALYPRVARVSLPRHAVKFARVAGGAVERDAGAHEWRATDMRGARVWVHPASVQFAETRWRSGIVVSFERVETSTKVFLRDVTEVQ